MGRMGPAPRTGMPAHGLVAGISLACVRRWYYELVAGRTSAGHAAGAAPSEGRNAALDVSGRSRPNVDAGTPSLSAPSSSDMGGASMPQ